MRPWRAQGPRQGETMARVLIVDDVEFVIEMYKDLLRTKGHEVVGTAFNGAEALDKYGDLNPDIVIMDVLMPEMDGLSALKKLLEIDPGARVLVVTAVEKPGLGDECIATGAMGFLEKPFEFDEFFTALTKILETERPAQPAPAQ